MSKMKISNTGLSLIKEFEGLRLRAYRCPAGVLTIGYGHTKNVRENDILDQRKAEYLLIQDLAWVEDVVNRECSNLNQNQFDALVSFVFNCGEKNFMRSTLLKCLKANPQNTNIRGEFVRWNKGGGIVLAGLIRRRRAEADLYFNGI